MAGGLQPTRRYVTSVLVLKSLKHRAMNFLMSYSSDGDAGLSGEGVDKVLVHVCGFRKPNQDGC